MQRQSGGSDCGLFAIAFATALCSSDNPHGLSYHQVKMRDHLHHCLTTERMASFPSSEKPRRWGQHRLTTKKDMNVYCTCCLPWFKADNSRGGQIQCHMCWEWHHQQCENIEDCAFNQPKLYLWHCAAGTSVLSYCTAIKFCCLLSVLSL